MKLLEETFHDVLSETILPTDQVVLVYSGIWSFSHRLGCPAKEVPGLILNWLEEFIGPNRTLIFPTYTLSFPHTGTYNPMETPSEVGILSQSTINRPGFIRTQQPIYNYTVKGPERLAIQGLPCTTSWGMDGVMGWVRTVNARICVLGVPWHTSCSYIHMAEELLSVPYRYLKTFHGVRATQNGVSTPCSEKMFVRSAMVPPEFDYSPVTQHIRSSASFSTSSNPFVPMESASSHDIINAGLDLLRSNQYVFVRNQDAVADWVKNGKDVEVGELEKVTKGENL